MQRGLGSPACSCPSDYHGGSDRAALRSCEGEEVVLKTSEQTEALVQRSVQLAEQRVNRRWRRAATGALLLSLIPGFPACAAVLIPLVLVDFYELVVSWQRRRKTSSSMGTN